MHPVPECPERSGPRDNFVFSGERVNFDYATGFLQLEADSALCSVIAVTEVDGAVLVAVPEQVWDRTKAKRVLPADALRRAVRVMVPGSIDEDRTTPEASPSFKIWLGVLQETYEAYVQFGDEEPIETAYDFPVDTLGLVKLPFAKALVAIAKDHFEFATAAEELFGAATNSAVEQRMVAMESMMKQVQASLLQLQGGGGLEAGRSAPPPAHPAGRDRAQPGSVAQPPLPSGIDAGLARQAMLSGVTPGALGEFAQILGGANLRPGAAVPRPAPRKQVVSDDEAEDLEEEDRLGDAGSGNPMERAVLQLSKIVSHLNEEKKLKKDKTLEALLDRAESGGGQGRDGLAASSRSKPAALRSLKKMLVEQPDLIYKALELRMEEDWSQSGSLPGTSPASITARGWLEHRSKIQNFQVPVRAAWCLGGVWDALRAGKVEEARARCALGVALLDELGIDKGSWLVASEVLLEDPPPFSSFATHRPLEVGESPHTKLIDERWLELFLAKLKDVYEFQEKRMKLAAGNRKQDEVQPDREKDKSKDQKGKKKGAGKGGGPKETEGEKTAPQA